MIDLGIHPGQNPHTDNGRRPTPSNEGDRLTPCQLALDPEPILRQIDRLRYLRSFNRERNRAPQLEVVQYGAKCKVLQQGMQILDPPPSRLLRGVLI